MGEIGYAFKRWTGIDAHGNATSVALREVPSEWNFRSFYRIASARWINSPDMMAFEL